MLSKQINISIPMEVHGELKRQAADLEISLHELYQEIFLQWIEEKSEKNAKKE